MDQALLQVWPIVLAGLVGIIWVVREISKLQTKIAVLEGQVKLLLNFHNEGIRGDKGC